MAACGTAVAPRCPGLRSFQMQSWAPWAGAMLSLAGGRRLRVRPGPVHAGVAWPENAGVATASPAPDADDQGISVLRAKFQHVPLQHCALTRPRRPTSVDFTRRKHRCPVLSTWPGRRAPIAPTMRDTLRRQYDMGELICRYAPALPFRTSHTPGAN